MMDALTLQPGESLRYTETGVKGAMGHSGISHRGTFPIPFIQELGCYITDRRVIVRAELFMGLFDTDFVAWFPGSRPEPDAELLLAGRLREIPLFGRCLELETEKDRPHILRGRKVRLQLFLPDPEAALEAIPAIVAERSHA